MLLNAQQLPLFWRLWSQACQAQGWTAGKGFSAVQIDARRKEFLAGCGFTSLTKVDRGDGFTKVKNELLILISGGSNVRAAAEADDRTANQARVWRYVIRTKILPCLALVPEVG